MKKENIMKIGITADVNLQETPIINLQLASFAPKPLLDVVTKNGHLPVVFPIAPEELAADYVSLVDGVIIPGGPDVSPSFFNEEPNLHIGTLYPARDYFERAVIKACIDQGKPVLGICRGTQLINVYYGGNLYQDLPSQYQGDLIQHSQASRGFVPIHSVDVTADSFTGQVFGATAFVNSRHHQAIQQVGAGLTVTAKAKDGVVEAIENLDDSVVGVQWHPENLWQNDSAEERLFTTFFDLVKEKAQWQQIQNIKLVFWVLFSWGLTASLVLEFSFCPEPEWSYLDQPVSWSCSSMPLWPS